ncbi:MAG TPA: IclR family transcriptional regulator [Stellaceae bacterium]|nr:IclR family transcriptional regulator [Stellaceae bacterium]
MSDAKAVPGLERGLNILRLFRRDRAAIAPPEMARELGIPRSTVHRIVATLEAMGFLRRVEGGGGAYAPGSAVLTIGFEYLGSLDIVQLSNPVLARLRDETNCSTHLAVRNGAEMVYLSRYASRGGVSSNVNIGSTLPAHATVIGRVVLADLAEAELAALYRGTRLERYTEHTPTTLAALMTLLAEDRQRGYAVSTSFYERGVTSVAAPVRDQSGKAVASINAVAVDIALDDQFLRGGLKDRVLAAAAAISAMLGAPAAPGAAAKRFGT